MVQEGKAKDAEKQPKTSNTKNYNFGNFIEVPSSKWDCSCAETRIDKYDSLSISC